MKLESMTTLPKGTRVSPSRILVPLFLYSSLVAAYFIVRYQGYWLEGDTSRLIGSVGAVIEQATLNPTEQAYKFGFGYPALMSFLALITDVSPVTLITLVKPFLLIIVGPVAFLFYRNFLKDTRLAAIAVLLLLLQPEFLFASLRGNHELFTWLFVLMAIYLINKSFSRAGSIVSLTSLVLLFYLTVYSLLSTQLFFSSSFLTGILLSLVIWLSLSRRNRNSPSMRHDAKRFVYVTLSSFVLLFILLFFLYPPAQAIFTDLRTVGDELTTFLSYADPAAVNNPYQPTLSVLWVSPAVYVGLSLANWVTLLASAVIWFLHGRDILLKRKPLERPLFFLWSFYTSYAIQIAFAMLLDLAGILSSNLQLRLFTGFSVLAVPFSASLFWRLGRFFARKSRRKGKPLLLVAAFFIVWFSGASLLKSSTDPVVSHKWTFRSNSEEIALQWAGTRIDHSQIWVGIDERLREVDQLRSPELQSHSYDIFRLERETRYILLSDITRMRARRLKWGLPDTASAQRVYDSGETQLFNVRPQTIHQR